MLRPTAPGWTAAWLLSIGHAGVSAAPESDACAAPVAHATPAAQPAVTEREHDAAITRSELERHVRVLASDAFEGRETGTPGGARAAGYLAGILKDMGAQPAGDDGGYLQDVELVRLVREGPPVFETRGAHGEAVATWGVDYDLRPDLPLADTGWLRVVLVTEEAQMPERIDSGVALFLDGSRRSRGAWLAAARGGAGSGKGSGGGGAGQGSPEARWGLLLYPGSRRPGRARSLGEGRLRPVPGQEEPWVVPRGDLLERLRSGGISALRLDSGLGLVPSGAANVIGILPGVGTPEKPELARETVVLSAHYDHLGLVQRGSHGSGHGDPAGGLAAGGGDGRGAAEGEIDRVYNGADDDASGTAAVLELAGALAAGEPPARTVVFLLATGEEKGLLGTKYYLDHPAVPLADTLFNLNFEMIGRPDELAGGGGGLWLTGHGRTTLWGEAREAGIEIFADQRPEEHFYERSDNYAFVMRGILGQTLSSYNMHRDYHRVSDEADLLDYAHMEQGVRQSLKLVRLLASGELTPHWIAGGEPQGGRR